MRPENDLVVVALGGNALLQRGEKLTADNQRRNAQTAAEAIARVIRSGYRVCVTHGNGPQVSKDALLRLQRCLRREDFNEWKIIPFTHRMPWRAFSPVVAKTTT